MDTVVDLRLKDAKIINLFSNEIQERDLYIANGKIAGFGPYEAKETISLKGLYVSPGLIEAHLHIESSLLIPVSLAKILIPCGTTTIIADPHEIANVMGVEGIFYMIEISHGLPLDFFFMAPSCVPASPFETSGAILTSDDLKTLREVKEILGIGEVMNYPGVINGDPELIKKIELFRGKPIDGHAPGLKGVDLEKYISAGIMSDHETTSLDEAKEKLDRGMFIMIREGSTAKNLSNLLPLVSPYNTSSFALVSDDLHPEDIIEKGHLDYLLRISVEKGIDPFTAIKMVTLNPAAYFGLKDRGAIMPGLKADLVCFTDLKSFRPIMTFKDGIMISHEGNLLTDLEGNVKYSDKISMNISWPETIKIKAKPGKRHVKVIEVIPGEILTKALSETPTLKDDIVISDIERDILKLIVFERHKASGNYGIGLVKGFGLKSGAIASSVAHDSHNLIVVGVKDHEIILAARRVEEMGGGIAVARDDKIIASLPLPVAGLMSYKEAHKVVQEKREIKKAVQYLGSSMEDPFMTLSFLALPVIPELKLTDRGLVDVNRFQLVDLFED